ncbi:family 10 glycosylhydrolase [Microcoleus sp. herbarium7]|uniref:family 10 glycosylhydrolase n=1 Tax=Microcoleus sp. herbarium7 TaxID=3055435 RepID=UPI002FCEB760
MKIAPTRIAKFQHQRRFLSAATAVLTSSFISQLVWPFIENKPAFGQASAYCQLSKEQVNKKEDLRRAALSGKPESQQAYFAVLSKHARETAECRQKTWPQTQAVWLRLYPCDVRPGEIDRVLDKVVNKGYNQVYIEVFYDGQVLLPVADNPTAWPSVLRNRGYEKYDLLEKAIAKGKQRGLKVYAWLFTMNFGYTYAQRSDRQQTLALNGKNQTSLTVIQDAGLDDQTGESHATHAFVDPYNPQAKQDYSLLVNQIVKRRPQGMLFDYIRYVRGVGAASVATKVQDLWIYGSASQQVLLQRASNQQGRDLIQRYLTKGFINTNDVQAVVKQYPTEPEPLWQGRIPRPIPVATPTPRRENPTSRAASKTPVTKSPNPATPTPKPTPTRPLPDTGILQKDLWQLSVAHAVQGILDFFGMATQPAQRMGIPVGAVFFPNGNQKINQGGFDSRLQPWDRFPASVEFHAMSYGNCGDVSCIVPQVQRTLSLAPAGAKIIPAIAGDWGKPLKNRPSLEVQMRAIRSATPQINAVSHFSFGWQEPEDERARQTCRL